MYGVFRVPIPWNESVPDTKASKCLKYAQNQRKTPKCFVWLYICIHYKVGSSKQSIHAKTLFITNTKASALDWQTMALAVSIYVKCLLYMETRMRRKVRSCQQNDIMTPLQMINLNRQHLDLNPKRNPHSQLSSKGYVELEIRQLRQAGHKYEVLAT